MPVYSSSFSLSLSHTHTQSVVTCMTTLYKSYSDDNTASCVVVGTENSDIYILDPSAFTFLSKVSNNDRIY